MRIELDDDVLTHAAVSIGEPVEVDLVTPGATGYEWKVELDEGHWERAGTALVPSLNAFGASGITRFELVPREPGSQELVFRLLAPWEPEPAREIRLTIEVAAEAPRE